MILTMPPVSKILCALCFREVVSTTTCIFDTVWPRILEEGGLLATCIFDTVWPRSEMTIRPQVESTKGKSTQK
jgi:hypothetical protein